MKKILGLDLGTNSIGWAVVNEAETEDNKKELVGIECAGSRIIPMDSSIIGILRAGILFHKQQNVRNYVETDVYGNVVYYAVNAYSEY